MTYEHDTPISGAIDMHMVVPSPGSPPGMISSKSSKTSSLRSSLASDDGVVVADVSHFEEIGLEDDSITVDAAHSRDFNQLKSNPNPYSASFTAQLRKQSTKHVGAAIHHGRPARSTSNAAEEPARPPIQRSITAGPKVRPSVPALKTQFRDTSTQNLTSLGPQHQSGPLPIRGLVVRSASSASANRRPRSPSPGLSPSALSSRDVRRPGMPVRRSSWQSTREPKSTVDLEKECDDDDDDIPDGVFLDNVPISPRPMDERPPSRAASMSSSASPERRTKSRVRSVGNGTPAVSVEQGSLRSPSWKSEVSSGDSIKSPGFSPSPTKGRAKSWNAALSALSAEARALTEKLEEHADEEDKHGIRGGAVARPTPKPRVKSALAELPPLRRTNIMIDPLPISKEKEAVLSRTRPSWLPPKDPAEEKKHLREYQRMMASSIEADKRREAARKEKEKNKDAMAENLIEMWEENVLKRWPEAVRERKTRELWWKGVAPRCRGTVWTKAIGNELGLTETSYKAALARAKEMETRASKGQASTEDERKMAWMEQMKRDVETTWVELKIFQSGGPLHQPLLDVLSAYAMYRSDIGYVSGCNTIAATLLLNLPSATTTFVALANLLNRALPLSFLAADQGAKSSAYNLVMSTLLSKAPRLHSHLMSSKLSIEFEDYLGSFFNALFTRDLCLDEVTRLWDVYVFEGDSVLVRAAVALLLEREGSLLAAQSRDEVLKVFSQGVQKTVAGRENEWMVKVRAAGKA